MKELYRIGLITCVIMMLTVIPAQATELIDAIRKGDKVKIEQLINKGADVNKKESQDGNTPLHEAVLPGDEYSGDINIIRLLIAKGAKINAVNNRGRTPLHWAAFGGNKAIAEFLIEKGAKINAKDNYGKTPLHIAGEEGYQYMYDLLIAKGASPDIEDNEGNLPYRPESSALINLFERAEIPSITYVEKILHNGGSVDETDKEGNTPLHRAVKGELAKQKNEDDVMCEKIAKLLIEKGANINAKNKYGETPLMVAVGSSSMKYINVIELLLDKGADVNAKNDHGKTSLHIAGEEKNKYIYDLLITKGANPDIKDNEGKLPVRPEKGGLINLFGHRNIPNVAYIEKIISNGGNVNETDEDGNTPLHRVVKGGIANQLDGEDVMCEKIAGLLIEKGADVNAKNKYGETPLMTAVGPFTMLYINVIELLLNKGADPALRDNNGKTPLDIIRGPGMSVYEEQPKVIKLLQAAIEKNKK